MRRRCGAADALDGKRGPTWLQYNAFTSKNTLRQKRSIYSYKTRSTSRKDGKSGDFARTAQRAGSHAWTKLSQVYVMVDGTVRRTASQVDTKFDISKKAQRALDQVSEQARYVDSQYGLKRRLQNASDDVHRKWPIVSHFIFTSPRQSLLWCFRASIIELLTESSTKQIAILPALIMWRKRYVEFSKTLPGQVLFISFIFLLFRTGIIWRLLNLMFIAWWLSPFLFLLLSKLNDKAAGQQEQEQQRWKRQQQQRTFFSSFFQNQRKTSPHQQSGESNRRKYDGPNEGPVIDVEYTTIDE